MSIGAGREKKWMVFTHDFANKVTKYIIHFLTSKTSLPTTMNFVHVFNR